MKKPKLYTVLILSGIILVFLYISGYRVTGLGAAKAYVAAMDAAQDHSALKGAEPFATVSYGWGAIYLFKSSNGFRTVVSEKKGFLWRAPGGCLLKNSSDAVKTVGGISYTCNGKGGATVFAVENADPEVASIEIGPETDRISKPIGLNSPVVFSWAEPLFLEDIKPVALSKTGKPLYKYSYNPQRPTVLKDWELKWYPVEENAVAEKPTE